MTIRYGLPALLLTALVALPGCLSKTIQYKQGVPVAQADRDALACRLKAEREVPVRMITRTIPGRYIPGHKVCTKPGECYITPGHLTPPQIISEDSNIGLRNQVALQCMADKGYQPVTLPPCPPSVAKSAPAGQTLVMPKLTQNSCVVRRGQSWLIVEKG